MKCLTLLFAILLLRAIHLHKKRAKLGIKACCMRNCGKSSKAKTRTYLGGNGLANSVADEDPGPVYVFLAINPETKEWALQEVSGDEACVIGYGTGFTIDADTMKKLSKPTT